MRLKKTQEAVRLFGKRVIQQARTNLTKKKMNVGNALYDSLKFKSRFTKKHLYIDFEMMDYGPFVDKGVKGTKSNYVENSKSPFSYKSKRPPIKPLAEWAKAKRIRLRDDKGRFARGNYQSIGYVLSKSIFEKGIRATMFFTKPFENEFKKLPDQVINYFGQDIDDYLKLQ